MFVIEMKTNKNTQTNKQKYLRLMLKLRWKFCSPFSKHFFKCCFEDSITHQGVTLFVSPVCLKRYYLGQFSSLIKEVTLVLFYSHYKNVNNPLYLLEYNATKEATGKFERNLIHGIYSCGIKRLLEKSSNAFKGRWTKCVTAIK